MEDTPDILIRRLMRMRDVAGSNAIPADVCWRFNALISMVEASEEHVDSQCRSGCAARNTANGKFYGIEDGLLLSKMMRIMSVLHNQTIASCPCVSGVLKEYTEKIGKLVAIPTITLPSNERQLVVYGDVSQ